MSKYELMSLVNAQLTAEEKENIYKQTTDCVIKGGGKVINAQVWSEKQRLSFSIKQCQEATYYLINFESAGSVMSNIRDLLRLNEKILRYLIIKAE